MPLLLKKDTVRLLSASKDSLFLGLVGLSIPRLGERKDDSCNGAVEIGLIGASIELAMGACLVQTFGTETLIGPSGGYKSARRILEEFKYLLQNPVAASSFLVKDVSDPEEHRKNLLKFTERFPFLITARASGLHGGKGCTRDVVEVQAYEVSRFLQLLSKSSRIKSYLSDIPVPPRAPHNKIVLVEDLVSQLRKAETVEAQGHILSNIFLVLPEIPKIEPDWIAAFDRISIAPKRNDVTLLLNTAQKAEPSILKRSSREGETLAVKVRSDYAGAVPIAPEYLRKAFTNLKDQWHSDINNANGRLEQGILDLPPDDFVLKLFSGGLKETGILSDENIDDLSHLDTWPYISSSLMVQGTCRPYWFLVRKTKDLDQLAAHLKRASSLGNKTFKSNLPEVLDGINHIKSSKNLLPNHKLLVEMLDFWDKAIQNWNKIPNAIDRNEDTSKAAIGEFLTHMDSVMEQELPLGNVLVALSENKYSNIDTVYWTKVLCQSAVETEDVKGLVTVLKNQKLNSAFSVARKSLRLIDFLLHGPPCEWYSEV